MTLCLFPQAPGTMLPFSIERLTAPDTPDMGRQRPPGFPRRWPYTSGRWDPHATLSPISPGVESTGSRDCSPDTSFEGLPGDLLPSPNGSEDSGRGSPDQLEEMTSPVATSVLRLHQVSKPCVVTTSQLESDPQHTRPSPEGPPLPLALNRSLQNDSEVPVGNNIVSDAVLRLQNISNLERVHHSAFRLHSVTDDLYIQSIHTLQDEEQSHLRVPPTHDLTRSSPQPAQQELELPSTSVRRLHELGTDEDSEESPVDDSPNPASCGDNERSPATSEPTQPCDEPQTASQEKPAHSYIGLISMALLASAEKKLVLSDIYQFIMDKFPYYNNPDRAWRNSIRHNLSLNECFIKAGRADNGKGNYWAIHPACVEDFAKGDFRRRQARRRARAGAMDSLPGPLPWSCRYPLTFGLPGYVPMTPTSMPSYHPYLPPFPFPPWPQPHCVPMVPGTVPRGLTSQFYPSTITEHRMSLAVEPRSPTIPENPSPSSPMASVPPPPTHGPTASASAHRFAPYSIAHRRW